MITVTVNPKARQNIYSLMVQKEIQLRKKNMGTLHRLGSKKKSEDKWVHSSYQGWRVAQTCSFEAVKKSTGAAVAANYVRRSP